MKIAYLILAHKNPDQILRLITRLNTDYISFFIHIDKRATDEIYCSVFAGLNQLSNVYFVKRHNSTWGRFGIVRAIIEGIKAIVDTGIYFDYVIHLSGQDYPIKSNTQIKEFLQENKGKEFLNYFSLPHSDWNNEYESFNRLERWHIYINNHHYTLPQEHKFQSPIKSFLYSCLNLLIKKRKLPKDFSLYGGSQFWCLTGECIKYVNDFLKRNRWFVNRFMHTFIPDELFFQTLILNSPFKDKIVNDYSSNKPVISFVDWENPNPLSPAILDKTYFSQLLKSKDLFARKFDVDRDVDILDMLDKIILSKEQRSKSCSDAETLKRREYIEKEA
ncbi:MAG: hypothetical protein JO235_23370 [Chroococcidiopsidaceae cyanobacterium CP_BM_RX_35]|nr:hypothetical protein [Chroococcidiopsidaceae cyanobacterium CP_BM_RX_35]